MEKKDLALLLTLVLALCGAVYKFGQLEGRISTSKIDEKIRLFEKRVDDAIEKTDEKLSLIENFSPILNQLPVGTIVAYGGDLEKICPDKDEKEKCKWKPCDGSILSKNEYPDLFSVIGTAWGTDGKEAFYLPDLQGRFLRGVDNGQGRDPNASNREAPATGGNKGDQVGSVQEYATARPMGQDNKFATNKDSGKHYHILGRVEPGYMHSGGNGDPIVPHDAAGDRSDVARTGKKKGSRYTRKEDDGGHFHTITSGGNQETRPRNANVQWLIKVQ